MKNSLLRAIIENVEVLLLEIEDQFPVTTLHRNRSNHFRGTNNERLLLQRGRRQIDAGLLVIRARRRMNRPSRLLRASGTSRRGKNRGNQNPRETWSAHSHLKSVYLIPPHFRALHGPRHCWSRTLIDQNWALFRLGFFISFILFNLHKFLIVIISI